mmetsp:Transcript_10565/g.26011  ORF Transcript_10565/g.26011 Transcript_10565/m.26011 type:complete len:221 (+) Transcript_10565:773-1435(+)
MSTGPIEHFAHQTENRFIGPLQIVQYKEYLPFQSEHGDEELRQQEDQLPMGGRFRGVTATSFLVLCRPYFGDQLLDARNDVYQRQQAVSVERFGYGVYRPSTIINIGLVVTIPHFHQIRDQSAHYGAQNHLSGFVSLFAIEFGGQDHITEVRYEAPHRRYEVTLPASCNAGYEYRLQATILVMGDGRDIEELGQFPFSAVESLAKVNCRLGKVPLGIVKK